MTDTNLTVLDGNGDAKTLRVTENSDDSLSYHNVLQGPDGSVATVSTGGALLCTLEQTRAAYRYCLLNFTPVANPTDFLIIQGNAAKVLYIKEIRLSGVCGQSGNLPIQIIRRSAANTPGSAVLTAITPAKYASTDGSASAAVSTVGTANCSALGASAGLIGAGRLYLATNATGRPRDLVWKFAEDQVKPIEIRGTAEFLVLNANAIDLPGTTFIDIEIVIEEAAAV